MRALGDPLLPSGNFESPMRLPAHERRKQLIATAIQVFARNGYHDTSMNAVAEAAGVTTPVLYQHFASQRDLYRDLLGAIARDRRNPPRAGVLAP